MVENFVSSLVNRGMKSRTSTGFTLLKPTLRESNGLQYIVWAQTTEHVYKLDKYA